MIESLLAYTFINIGTLPRVILKIFVTEAVPYLQIIYLMLIFYTGP